MGRKSSECPDAELMAMLDARFTWTVTGRQNRVHCMAWNLRSALESAARFDKSWPQLMQVRRQPSDDIIVSGPQWRRLEKLVAEQSLNTVESSVTA